MNAIAIKWVWLCVATPRAPVLVFFTSTSTSAVSLQLDFGCPAGMEMKLFLRSLGRVIDASHLRSRLSFPSQVFSRSSSDRLSALGLSRGCPPEGKQLLFFTCGGDGGELRLRDVLVQQMSRGTPLRRHQGSGQSGGRPRCERPPARSARLCPELQLNNKHRGSGGAGLRRGSGGHRRAEPRGCAARKRPEPGRSPRVLMQIRLERRKRRGCS